MYEKDLEKNIADAVERNSHEYIINDEKIKKEPEILQPIVQLSEKEIELKKIRDARIAHFSKILKN